MSMRIPCIATNISNQSLGAKHKDEIVEVSNSQELADAVLLLLRDTNLRVKIAANGQAFVHNNYSWDVANEQLRLIIDRLL